MRLARGRSTLAQRGTRGHASEISGGDGMMRGSSAVCAGQCVAREVLRLPVLGWCGRTVGGRLACLSLPEFFGDFTRA